MQSRNNLVKWIIMNRRRVLADNNLQEMLEQIRAEQKEKHSRKEVMVIDMLENMGYDKEFMSERIAISMIEAGLTWDDALKQAIDDWMTERGQHD